MGICCISEKSRTIIIPGMPVSNSEIFDSAPILESNYNSDILNHFRFIRVCGYG